MIVDPITLQEVHDSWETVRDSRNILVGNLNVASIVGRPQSPQFRDLCFNLLMIVAFSVIEDVLRQLRDEGCFSCKDNRMNSLMKASEHKLPWVAFGLVDDGREHRNKSAHKRVFLKQDECLKYVAAIETELVAWSILPSATPELWSW